MMVFPAMSAMFDESGEYLFLTGSKDDEPHEPMVPMVPIVDSPLRFSW